MNKLAAWCITPPSTPVTPWKTIVWWEARRLPFNIAVWIVGVIAMVIYEAILEAHPPYIEAGMEGTVVAILVLELIFVTNLIFLIGEFIEVLFRIRNRYIYSAIGVRAVLLMIFLIWISLPVVCWTDWHATLEMNLKNSP
jgi:hypothetical protein